RARRAARAPRPRRPVRQPDARPPRRAADRAQLLLRRPARAALRAVVGRRPAPRRRAARAPPPRARRGAADGRARRLGGVGHARADAERLAVELGAEAAWRRATTRVFGSKPGTYGAGLLQLLDARDWRGDADLAEVYEAWGGWGYGRGLDGAPAADAMRDCYARVEIAVKNVDNREHDILDPDDYHQYHGGMVATVRALTGREPAAYLGDSADPSR